MAARRRNNYNQDNEFDEQVIDIARVSRVVKGGRRFRFRALVAVGDNANRVGVGVAKGADVSTAISKASDVAKKNLITVPITEETIPHEIEVKHSGAHILIKPARQGTGVIAGGALRAVIELTGINNLLSKSFGSSNKINNAYAAIKALENLKPVDETVKNTDTAKETA